MSTGIMSQYEAYTLMLKNYPDISCKSAGGFGDDAVYLTLMAVRYHAVEIIPFSADTPVVPSSDGVKRGRKKSCKSFVNHE